MRPFLRGIGLLASGLRLPVVPLRIHGLFELKRRRRLAGRPGQLSIAVGSPARYDARIDPATITRDLERRVADLAPASSR